MPPASRDILCTPAREVTEFSPAPGLLAVDLADTLHHHGAAGLASPQAGISFRLAVVEREGGEPLVLMNPRVTAWDGPVTEGIEECLSVPGTRSVVERHHALGVTYQDAAGARPALRAEGLPARVIAHEVDHVDGIPGPADGAGSVQGGGGTKWLLPSRGAGAPRGWGRGPSGRYPLHRPGDPRHGTGRALKRRDVTRRGRRTGGRRRSS
jgi:peptide deformylase